MRIHMATEKLETRIRREQIVQAALSLVGTDGLERLSVARVARRIGVVPSALYRHFSGKDEIVDALLAAVLQRLEDNARAARDEADDALGRIRALLVRHVAMITEHPGLPRLVLSEDVYAGRPARRARMFKGIARYLERVAEFVREGQERGELRADVSPAAASHLFLGLVQPAALLRQLSAGRFDVRQHVDEGWALFERALRKA
jgi:AcrR family transcriptional regulator